ncbi:MAG: polysaccharide deacetylase family protein [Candidatus Hodarchaeota archaeon]
MRFILSSLLYYSGLFYLCRKFILKGNPIILTYHRVIDPQHEKIPLLDGIYVTKSTFQKHMDYLSKNCTVVPLHKIVNDIKNGRKFKDFTCSITFDDGWRDNYKHAFPVLKKYDLPATIFLATSFIGTNEWFWHDKVIYLIYRFMKTRNNLRREIEQLTRKWPYFLPLLNRPTLSENQLNEVISNLKKLSMDEINEIVNEMKTTLKLKDFPSNRLVLNWGEIHEMAMQNITFGSHTANHLILTNLLPHEIASQLSRPKKTLEQHLNSEVTGFCYPNGDFNSQLKQMVKDNGYEYAVTSQKRPLTNVNDLYEIGRIHVHNDIAFSKAMFACLISRVYDIFQSHKIRLTQFEATSTHV